MADEVGDNSCFRLLQPELMTVVELRDLLVSRCVTLDTIKDMSKEMLINLYRRVVLPLPQRECYRKKLSKGRQAVLPPDDFKKDCSYTFGFNGSANKKSNITSSGLIRSKQSVDNERLKPPPDVANGVKKIKLSKLSSDLDNIVIINKRRKSDEKQAPEVLTSPKSEKRVDNKLAVKSERCEDSNTEQPKKVKLKRSFIGTKLASTSNEIDDMTDERKPKAKITWP